MKKQASYFKSALLVSSFGKTNCPAEACDPPTLEAGGGPWEAGLLLRTTESWGHGAPAAEHTEHTEPQGRGHQAAQNSCLLLPPPPLPHLMAPISRSALCLLHVGPLWPVISVISERRGMPPCKCLATFPAARGGRAQQRCAARNFLRHSSCSRRPLAWKPRIKNYDDIHTDTTTVGASRVPGTGISSSQIPSLVLMPPPPCESPYPHFRVGDTEVCGLSCLPRVTGGATHLHFSALRRRELCANGPLPPLHLLP